MDTLQNEREKLFHAYTDTFAPLQSIGLRIIIPNKDIEPNFHAFWIIFGREKQRQKFIGPAKSKNIAAYIGYVPLHNSLMGKKINNDYPDLPITEFVGKNVVRLPFYSMNESEIEYTCKNLFEAALISLETK